MDTSNCTLAYVRSPNGKYSVRVSVENSVPIFSLIHNSVKHGSENLAIGWFIDMEIMWAPDSSAVSFSWNDNATDHYTRVYTISNGKAVPVDLRPVMKDFIRDYPPCVENYDPTPCPYRSDGKDTNELVVGWAAPHTVVLMSEASESSEYGRNMAQVTGYEVDASSGAILRKMDAREFQRRWQTQMGWQFQIPESPQGL